MSKRLPLDVFHESMGILLITRQIEPESLREAFEYAVDILGENMKMAMLRELRARIGVDFSEPTLTILRLHEALAVLYGETVAEMITESMIVRLDEMIEQKNRTVAYRLTNAN